MSLLVLNQSGLYCQRGDFYVDPWRPVDDAVVTHAHADHGRPGSRNYLCAQEGASILRARIGDRGTITGTDYGETTIRNGVKVTLFPAGHILGSSQVLVEYRGERVVVTGDYKTTPDPTSTPFELVQCHTLITECTFGLPVYRWPDQSSIFEEINGWWRRNAEAGRASILFAYSLGKAQRVLAGLDASVGPIFTHGAVERINELYRASGIELPPTTYATTGKLESDRFRSALIVAPPSANGTTWLQRFTPYSTGFASGWMAVRGRRRQRSVDRGFILSDHVDWTELLEVIRQSGAEKVLPTHGFTDPLARYLREIGLESAPLRTEFEGELDDTVGGESEASSETGSTVD